MKCYAGIGSRETPQEAKWEIHAIALYLADNGWTLRSGGADGADLAFEYGAGDGPKEIFLPWRGFNKNPSLLYEIPERAYEISAQHHPSWNYLRPSIRNLMARNAQQILGKNLDSPVQFVICWTPDGCTKGEDRIRATGGTGQAISIASSLNIPIFNLKNVNARDDLLTYVETYERSRNLHQ